MSETEMDQRLERLFQAALGLTQEQEDALARRFVARVQEDRYAWAAFAAVMTGLRAGLQPATDWLRRPIFRVSALW